MGKLCLRVQIRYSLLGGLLPVANAERKGLMSPELFKNNVTLSIPLGTEDVYYKIGKLTSGKILIAILSYVRGSTTCVKQLVLRHNGSNVSGKVSLITPGDVVCFYIQNEDVILRRRENCCAILSVLYADISLELSQVDYSESFIQIEET